MRRQCIRRDDVTDSAKLQIDLASAVARLEQLRDMPYFDSSHWLWDRVASCDIPRLRGHLGPEAVELLERLNECAAPGE